MTLPIHGGNVLRKPIGHILAVFLIPMLISFGGCNETSTPADIAGPQGEQGPTGDTGLQGDPGADRSTDLNLIATVELSLNNPSLFDFRATVYNASSLPDLSINDLAVDPEEYWLWDGGRLAYKRNSMSVPDSDSANIIVEYTKLDNTVGSATAAVRLAGPFNILDDTLWIEWGDDATITWEHSDGADAYWVAWYNAIKYQDTAGINHTSYVRFDTLMSAGDSTLVLSTGGAFPSLEDSIVIAYFYGYVWVRAVTGPWLPGQVSNVIGDCTGTFVGSTYARTLHLKYADPQLQPADPVEPTQERDALFLKRIVELSKTQKQERQRL
jgi:hypothetical protein